MGTSTVHRSPATPRWRLVNNLYDDPTVSIDRLLSEVFNAAELYPSGLAEPAVLVRVENLLAAARAGDWQRGSEAALGVARETMRTAQAEALRAGYASFFGDLADRALHTTLAGAARDPDVLTTATTALGAFLCNLVGTVIDHVVSRDLSAHVGGGRVSGAAQALALRRALVQRGRAVAADERLLPAVEAAAAAPQQRWRDLVHQVWQTGAAAPRRREEQSGA